MDVVRICRWEGQGFVFLLAALIAYRLLTGKINLSGLLGRGDGSGVSPERVQLLLATLAMSMTYLGQAVHGTGNSLPEISTRMLFIFGGSSTVYASVKAWTTLRTGER